MSLLSEYIITATGTETMTHPKLNKIFLKTPISAAFLGHCVPLGSLSQAHKSTAHAILHHGECGQRHSHFLERPVTAAHDTEALLSTWGTAEHMAAAAAVPLDGLPLMVLLSALMLSFTDCVFQESGSLYIHCP